MSLVVTETCILLTVYLIILVTMCARVVYEYTRSYPYYIIGIGLSILVNDSSAHACDPSSPCRLRLSVVC